MTSETTRRIDQADQQKLMQKLIRADHAAEADQVARRPISQPIMASNSLPADSCSGCGGLGYYLLRVPFTHPQWGKPQPCECKQRRDAQRAQQQLQQRLQAERGIYADATLAGFDWSRDTSQPATWVEAGQPGQPLVVAPAKQRESLDLARQQLDRWVAAPSAGLFITGPYGTGKTHIAAALANSWSHQGRSAQYCSTPVLLRDLRAGIADHSTDRRLQQFIGLDLLALDDLGAEHLTDWSGAQLFDLINERYNAGRITIVTSNYPIAKLVGRVASRLMAMCDMLPVVAYDYRAIQAARRRGAA